MTITNDKAVAAVAAPAASSKKSYKKKIRFGILNLVSQIRI